MEDSKIISPDEQIAMLTSVNAGYVREIKAQRFQMDVMRRFITALDRQIKTDDYNAITLEFYMAMRAQHFSNLN